MPPKWGRGRGHWRGRGRGGRGKPQGQPKMDEAHVEVKKEEDLVDPEDVKHEEQEDAEEAENVFLKEVDVGITEYISSLPGFSGIIKQRYSDFIVNEIDEDGQIVKLTNIEVDEATAQATEEELEEDVEGILTDEQTETLASFNENPSKDRTLDIYVPDDKVHRAKVHQIVRVRYKNLESDTITEDDLRFVRVVQKGRGLQHKRQQYFHDRNQDRNWPKDCGKYCRFVLYKENLDTMDAIFKLTKFFHLSKNMFQFAGTKDKRAISSQEVTAYRVKAEKLLRANRYFYKMSLGNFRYVDQPLKLGQLHGNRFTIVLRNVSGTDDVVEASMKSLKTMGFINYFGMQRFGSTSIPTYQIGKELLKSNYKSAAELILKPRPGEKEHIADCRRQWWKDKDSLKMLSLLPRRYSIERALLEGLIKFGEENYANAFQKIHRNTRLLYLHGYQSYIWNSVVSRRIKQFGMKPIIGDLVYKGPMKDISYTEDHDDEEAENGSKEEKPAPSKLTPTVVTSKNLSQYTIQDVILPLPGFDIKYPENEVGNWYLELLAADDLTLESLKHSNKQYALPGAYRRMIMLPIDVTWKTYKYTDVTKELTLSDLDIIQGKPEPESDAEGSMKALKIEMTLLQSCYATMALREILKIDTSAAYQSTLNAGVMPDRMPTALAIKEFQAKQEKTVSD